MKYYFQDLSETGGAYLDEVRTLTPDVCQNDEAAAPIKQDIIGRQSIYSIDPIVISAKSYDSAELHAQPEVSQSMDYYTIEVDGTKNDATLY